MTPGNLLKLSERLRVKFVGGRPCLDFVNTVGGRTGSGGVIRDKLAGYQDLLDWSRLAGSLDDRTASALGRQAELHRAEAAAVFERAIRLRETLYRIFQCALSKKRPIGGDLDGLRAELADARMHQQLTAQADGFAWTFPPRSAELDRLLWPVALSAAELMTSGDLARLGQCGGADCGWLFVDTSRNGRRRWCDMQDCGNRAKVRRFRSKVS